VSKKQAKVSIERLSIRAFGPDVLYNAFDCGRDPINKFLKNKAPKVSKRLEYSVFTAHNGKSPRACGYYALQVSTDRADDIAEKNRTYLKTYSYFPAVELSFLGVDESFQGQGVGTFLLMDVFQRVALISKHIGFYALLLTALDREAKDFYLSLGFHVYPDPSGMRMMLTLREIIDLQVAVG
jgi:GNAT superfamily N-acetyltransferase